MMSARKKEKDLVLAMDILDLSFWEKFDTSLVSFDHKLINRLQLSVVELAYVLLFDVWHVKGAGVFEVLKRL